MTRVAAVHPRPISQPLVASFRRLIAICFATAVVCAASWAIAQTPVLSQPISPGVAPRNPVGPAQAAPMPNASTPINTPLSDPNSTVAPTPFPPAPPTAFGPAVEPGSPAKPPVIAPSPLSGPIGPLGSQNPAAPETPAATSSPSSPASPAVPTNRPDLAEVGIPPNTFGHLGVSVETLPNGDGLRVVGIEPTSPAFPAGLLIGDEITSINGKRIAKFADLVAGLRAAAEGDGNVSLLVRRRGTLDTINVMVGGKKAQTDRPKLGVTLDDSNGRLLVSGVAPNGPAAKAGLQPGDEIITVNDYPVSTYDLFVGQIQAMGRAGGVVSLGIRRNGQMLTLHATIGSAKPLALPKSELPSADINAK